MRKKSNSSVRRSLLTVRRPQKDKSRHILIDFNTLKIKANLKSVSSKLLEEKLTHKKMGNRLLY